jgi:hypothetical protein
VSFWGNVLLTILLKLIPKSYFLRNLTLYQKKKLNLAWQCVPAFPSDNEKHKNRKILSKPAWAKQPRSYFKNNQRISAGGIAQVKEHVPSKCKNSEFKSQYGKSLL